MDGGSPARRSSPTAVIRPGEGSFSDIPASASRRIQSHPWADPDRAAQLRKYPYAKVTIARFGPTCVLLEYTGGELTSTASGDFEVRVTFAALLTTSEA